MEQGQDSNVSRQPLRVLSLDGGGIRGMSSLHILGDIMEKIGGTLRLDHTPRPCEHFDLIGGTSTGGIIAIMLGRLGMTVDECIAAYRNVAEQAFTPKRTSIIPSAPTGAFSAKALEAAIKRTVREFCVETECVERRMQGQTAVEPCPHSDIEFRDGTCTKTAVLAITKDNVDAQPTLFTTYDTSAAFRGCTIWQAARATSAATTFFKSIKVGRDGIEFVDAGFGYNNPCEVLIDEARQQFPGREQMRVLSIGTGLGDVVSIQNTRWSILDALKTMATSSKKVAARLESRFSDTGQYYRFNVERGLEDITLSDWEKTSKISAHTHNYLQENRRAVKKFVDNFLVETEHGPGGDLAQAEHGTAGGGRPKSSSPFTEQGQPVSSRQPSVGRDVLTIPSPAARSGTQETQVSVASAATAFEEVSRVTKLDRSPDEDQKGGTWTILHAAVRMNNFQGVATILARGFDPNSQDERGLTPILVAACLGLLEISQRLVGAGAKVNITSFLGSTPLREAAAIGAVKLVQFLLESGADLELAPHEHRDTPLITAAAKNHLEVVNLLLAAGANTRAQTNGGWSPLHYALFSKNKDMAIEILQHNPDVNSSTIVGLRPLHLAAIAGFPAICAQMLDLGAEMDATDDGGVTALRAAVQEGQLEVVKFLVENGSRTDVLAADRHSLCDMALIFGQEAVYQYLEGRVTAG